MHRIKVFYWLSVYMFFVGLAYADTYYIRTDGGTAAQCTGKSDTSYPGFGVNQPCAFNHPFWAISPIGNNPTKMVGGDTLIIGPGEYMMGYGAPNTADTSKCHPGWPWDCFMRSIPSGPSPANPTRILGKGWDAGCVSAPKLWGTERTAMILNLNGSNNVAVHCLEVTDKSECQQHGIEKCNRDTFPYGRWAVNGISASDSENVLLKNINIHGLAYRGIHAGRLKDWTIEDVDIVANSFVGWDGDIGALNSSNSGTLTFKNVNILYNGCGERLTGTPHSCYSQSQGGYGDGLGTHQTGGDWIFEDTDISFNTSDGLDLLYHNGQGSVTILRSRFAGNAGNQVKVATSALIEDSIIRGDCDYFLGKAFTSSKNNSGGSQSFDHCRASGDTAAFAFSSGRKVEIKNTPFSLIKNIGIISSGDGCNGSEVLRTENVTFDLSQNRFHSPSQKAVKYYATGNNGNGAGSCGTLKLTEVSGPATEPQPEPEPDLEPEPTPEPCPECPAIPICQECPNCPTCPTCPTCPDLPDCPEFRSATPLTATQFGSVKAEVYDRADKGEKIYFYHSTRKALYELKIHQLPVE